jgi:hypothetical protein
MKTSFHFAIALFLAACGGSNQTAETPATNTAATTSAAATSTPSATASAPVATAPTAPTASIAGSTLTWSYGGATYALSHGTVVLGDSPGDASLQFEQPMEVGYNQIWLSASGIKKGAPAKVHGYGMSGAFVQIAKGKDDVHNVSNNCKSDGSITFDAMPANGKKSSGKVDVTITCDHVAALSAPLVIQGTFADVPVSK